MGTVVLAVREDDFSKKVALKLIRREKLSEELLSRFHMERQILASLDHPNIASIHDGGTTEDGLPYFAMEYVSGEPIDRYCDTGQLSIRQRLKLFREVCSAVQMAHQSLVIHRDLKPGNILVTSGGVPKLIDFGIAKPLSSELASQGLATAPDSRPMTPKYASPEQVRGTQITTATDIYSLGVLLFTLLTGEDPYPLDSPDIIELGRVICDVEPKKPSTVAGSGAGDSSKLRRRLAGDLDSIVLKALHKDRHDRYSSVEQFSEDIRRHLVGLPVIAREGTFPYRAEKYLRRNWRPLTAAAAVLLMVVTSAMMWLGSVRRVERAELAKRLAAGRAGDAERQAEVLSGLLKNLFIKAFNPNDAQGKLLTAAEVLERGKGRIRTALEGEPELLATQLEAMGMVHKELGHYADTQPLLEESLRLRRRFYNGGHPLLARGLHNLANLFQRTGEYRRAEILYLEVLRMRRRLGQQGVDLVKPMNALASIHMYRGDYAEVEKIYRRVLAIREEAYGREDIDVATSLLSLGTLFYVRGDLKRAELPEYEDWREKVLARAQAVLAEASGDAAEKPGGKVIAFPSRRWWSLAIPYAVAASILVALGLGLVSQRRQIADLRRLAASRLEEPLAGQPLAWFNTLQEVRGEPIEITLPSMASHVLLLVDVNDPDPYPAYRLEIGERDTELHWISGDLLRVGVDDLSAVLPRRLLPAGEVPFRIYGVRAGQAELVAEYTVQVEIE